MPGLIVSGACSLFQLLKDKTVHAGLDLVTLIFCVSHNQSYATGNHSTYIVTRSLIHYDASTTVRYREIPCSSMS